MAERFIVRATSKDTPKRERMTKECIPGSEGDVRRLAQLWQSEGPGWTVTVQPVTDERCGCDGNRAC